MCNGSVFYFIVLQLVIMFLYGIVECNGSVFYYTVLQCVTMVCFIVLYCSV